MTIPIIGQQRQKLTPRGKEILKMLMDQRIAYGDFHARAQVIDFYIDRCAENLMVNLKIKGYDLSEILTIILYAEQNGFTKGMRITKVEEIKNDDKSADTN